MTTENPEPNLGELIASFELANRAEGLSPSTISGYAEQLAPFSRFLNMQLGHCGLSLFTVENARHYILHEKARHRFEGHPFTPEQPDLLSSATIQSRVRALKAFSTFLHEEGRLEANVMRKLKMPKAVKKLFEPLTPDEIRVVHDSIDMSNAIGQRNRAIFDTMLDSGLRAGGVASLTVGAAHLDEGYLKVMEKGSKERVVPIGKHVQATLRDFLDRVRPMLVNEESADFLFLSQDGKPVTVNSLKLTFARLARKSSVRRLHAHLCRHTFALSYLMNGGDVFSLKEILGHSSFEMVDRYLRFTNAQIQARHSEFSPMDRLYAESGPATTSPPPAVGGISDPNGARPEQ